MFSLTLDRWFAMFAILSPALTELSGPVTEDHGDTLLGVRAHFNFFIFFTGTIQRTAIVSESLTNEEVITVPPELRAVYCSSRNHLEMKSGNPAF